MTRARVIPIVVVLALGALALVFRADLVAWFGGRTTGGRTSSAAHVTSGDLSIDTVLQPDPPRESGNEAHVAIHDAHGKPVLGAKVHLEYDMPAMGAMREMKGGADATEDGSGHYTIVFDLPMAGSWAIDIRVGSSAGNASARYSLRVGSPGLTVLGGTPGSADTTGAALGVIQIDEPRRAQLGIRTAKVTKAPINLDLRAEGRIVVDETRMHDVTLKIGGYISDLKVNATGQTVRKGDVLFTMYSPDLYAAEQEYLVARRNGGLMVDNTARPAGGDALLRAAETKLRLWGLGDDQLEQIAAKGEPIERVPFRSPASGVVIEKDVVDGASVTAGQRLFRIADLDEIWVEANLYEADLARIAKGQLATITMTYLPGRTFAGKVAFIYPYLDPTSRTGRVRIALPNKGLELKPEMYASVMFALALGDRLQIPVTAVVYTGPRRIVFVNLGNGKLRPQEVTIGARSGDMVEVLTGLEEGDVVVSSGNFLVAAESRVRSGGALWEDSDAKP